VVSGLQLVLVIHSPLIYGRNSLTLLVVVTILIQGGAFQLCRGGPSHHTTLIKNCKPTSRVRVYGGGISNITLTCKDIIAGITFNSPAIISCTEFRKLYKYLFDSIISCQLYKNVNVINKLIVWDRYSKRRSYTAMRSNEVMRKLGLLIMTDV